MLVFMRSVFLHESSFISVNVYLCVCFTFRFFFLAFIYLIFRVCEADKGTLLLTVVVHISLLTCDIGIKYSILRCNT